MRGVPLRDSESFSEAHWRLSNSPIRHHAITSLAPVADSLQGRTLRLDIGVIELIILQLHTRAPENLLFKSQPMSDMVTCFSPRVLSFRAPLGKAE